MTKQARIVINRRCGPTITLMRQVALRDFDLNLTAVNHVSGIPTIYCGENDGFTWTKPETLLRVEAATGIHNTLVRNWGTIQPTDTVFVKDPNRVGLWRDLRTGEHRSGVYKWIPQKDEWRINVSYGVVNQVLNKNIINEVFGKADATQWSPEEDKEVRKTLIKMGKDIYTLIASEFPLVEHFGLDVIRDRTTGNYYLLEINRANGLNEESCGFLLKGFVNKYFPVRTTTPSPVVVEDDDDEDEMYPDEDLDIDDDDEDIDDITPAQSIQGSNGVLPRELTIGGFRYVRQ
jgi:hypothetical protein